MRENTYTNDVFNRNFFEINNQQGYQCTYTFQITQQFFISYKEIIEFEPAYTLNPTITYYEQIILPEPCYL